MTKEVIIYHTKIDENSSPDNLDVLQEAKFVSENLKKLDYVPRVLPFDEEKAKREIKKIKPEFIFNLVESIDGTDSLAYLSAELFEKLKVPYTGNSRDALFFTADKIKTKKILRENKIKTPKFLTLNNSERIKINKGEKFLIKNSKEHASLGLDETTFSLLENKGEIIDELSKRKDCFAEQYIDGREFNISVIGNPARILPVAEIKFNNYPEEKPKIIGYRAKWDEKSFEYANTNRTFDFEKEDEDLLEELKKICLKCWEVFGLNGYARIDFRIKNNAPYVLEINANPCISPDAGFVAACEKEGLKTTEIIQEIIENLNGK